MNQTTPVAILYDDNEQMTMLQANALYLDALHSIGTPSVERGKATSQWELMTYVDNGQYMRLTIKEIAARGPHSVH